MGGAASIWNIWTDWAYLGRALKLAKLFSSDYFSELFPSWTEVYLPLIKSAFCANLPARFRFWCLFLATNVLNWNIEFTLSSAHCWWRCSGSNQNLHNFGFARHKTSALFQKQRKSWILQIILQTGQMSPVSCGYIWWFWILKNTSEFVRSYNLLILSCKRTPLHS